MARRQSGQAEQREARRQVDKGGALGEARRRGQDPLRRALDADSLAKPAPQLGLPVGVDSRSGPRIGGAQVARPGLNHVGTVHAVMVEQIGEVPNGGEAPERSGATCGWRTHRCHGSGQGWRRARDRRGERGPGAGRSGRRGGPEMGGERLQKWLVQAGVDHLQQRPHRPLR